MGMPQQLGLIAGRGAYPRLLAESARKQGVRRLFVVAFKKETDSVIEKLADEVRWIHLGQLGALLEAFRESGVAQAVMAGQIAPKHFFSVRMDAPLLAVIRRLRTVNAETLFAAIGEELKAIGIELLPAYLFMESAMPEPGPLGHRPLTEQERADVELGLRTAKAVSALEIGQTVVVKRGVILAVEAFEGTDETILRAGRLAGDGSVVVKVAKRGHDMRFDIPVVGERTLKVLKKAGASVLAVEARRTILLEREKIVQEADRQGLGLLAVEGDSP
ncbi:MAG: UDP-2,3-diacylglucosamine diphosphatase LpxI [Lentisphaerae bacterium]|nr:UDP-2,3-diacylglucosamine diphosphatase LpxI [Lentisphaerota bacterium]